MSKPRRWPALMLSLAASVACNRTEKPAPPTAPQVAKISLESVKADVERALAELSRVRGLAVKHRLTTKILEPDEYRRLYAEERARTLFGDGQQFSIVLSVLNFADPDTAAPSNLLASIIDTAQNAAFYDSLADTLYLTRPKNSKYQAADDTAVVMALERALHVQNFGPSAAGVDIDQHAADLALREGDAWASAIAYFAARSGKPLVETLDQAAKLTSTLPPDALATAIGYKSALASAPLLARDTLFRARASGLQLVADLIRTGGFPLVDRALQSPPVSMLDVLDPTFYVRGWKPAVFPSMIAPSGFKEEFSSSLGPVGVLSFVERCESSQRARSYAGQWRGDAASFFNSGSASVVLWRTAWRDETAARSFADYVSTTGQCKPAGPSFAVHFEVLQKGNLVSLTTLRDESRAPALLASASISRIKTDKFGTSPIGVTTLAPPGTGSFRYAGREQISVRGVGAVFGRTYTNPRIGIELEIPSGFEFKTDEILAIDHAPPSLASGRISFEQTSVPFGSQNDFFAAFSAKVSSAIFRGAQLVEVESGQLQTALGPSVYRSYELRNGAPAHVRLVAMPICGGHAALIATQVYLDEQGKELLEKWVQSFKPTARTGTVCGDLATGQ